MKYYKDINNIVNDMLTIGNETEKREKELMEEEKNYNDKLAVIHANINNKRMIAVYEKYLDIIWNDLSPPMQKRLEKHFKDIANEINRIKEEK